jgi:hypothetical protein
MMDNISVILPCGDGGYMCAGNTSSNDGQVSGNHGGEDFWIIKIDHTGNLVWQKCYGGSLDECPLCMKASSDGNYLVGGYTYSNDGDVAGNHSASSNLIDMWLIKISPDGTLLWQQCIGGDGNEELQDFLELPFGRLLLLGSSNSTKNSGDVKCNFTELGEMDIWLVSMTDTTYVGIDDNKNRNSTFKVFPNPANSRITISYISPLPGETDISIFKITGEEVMVGKFRSQHPFEMDVSNLPKGMYLVKLQTRSGVETQKFVIQ